MNNWGTLRVVSDAGQTVPFPGPARTRDRWRDLPLATPRLRRHFLSGTPLVDYFRDDPAALAFDRLRTDLRHTLAENGWRRIAVAAPSAGCGSTFTTVNLGQSFARIRNCRTLLVDLNMRRPGLADAFDLTAAGDMPGYLNGAVPLERQIVRVSDTLALGLAGQPAPDAAGILLDQRFDFALDRMTGTLKPDVVFFDLPPVLEFDDFAAVLPQMDAVLLVAGAEQTSSAQISACRNMLDGRIPLLGVALNRVGIPAAAT